MNSSEGAYVGIKDRKNFVAAILVAIAASTGYTQTESQSEAEDLSLHLFWRI